MPGLSVLIHEYTFRGVPLVVMERFDLENFCKLVQKHRAAHAYVVPPVALLLSKHPTVAKYDLSSLKGMTSAAAPLTKELIQAVYDRLKIPLLQAYGLSETSPGVTTMPAEDALRYPGSVGKLNPNMTAKVIDLDSGDEVPVGTEGELWFSGPNVFKGYLNNPSGTANALTADGFFKTGDVGYVDKLGNWYITDRVKELIKFKGFQVAPAQLEGILIAHASIDDVAVIGVYDESQATEIPRAYVVPAKGVQKNEARANEICIWLEGKVSNYKRLRGGVRFVEAIPKSATGKILRRVLRDEAAKEAGGKTKTGMPKL
jgi:4-coumarate--CoA ligase